eukprot:COSAG01_NODE_2366_length_7816_cov_3.797460_6_plen_100_part_00
METPGSHSTTVWSMKTTSSIVRSLFSIGTNVPLLRPSGSALLPAISTSQAPSPCAPPSPLTVAGGGLKSSPISKHRLPPPWLPGRCASIFLDWNRTDVA